MFAIIPRLAGACLALSLACGSASAEELVIGQVAPLSGVLADTGRDMVLGARVYFDYVNDHGGVHGRKIRHVVKDDGYQVAETVRLTREVIAKDGALALIGFAGTGNVAELLAQKVLEQAGIALVAPYTGGEVLREPFNPYIFHIRAGYADETEGIVNQLVMLNMTSIAVMYQDDPFGRAGLAGVEAALKKRNLKVAATGAYAKNTDEVAQTVRAIAPANPQAVIMISVNKSTAAFSKQIRAAATILQLVNISVVNPTELARLIGTSNARGIGIAQVMPYPYSPTVAIVKEYQQAMKRYAPGTEPSYASLEEFIGAKVLVEGLRRAGPNPTREKVIQALESLHAFDVGGFTLNFSSDNRIGSRFVEITVIGKDGRLLR
ncbi:ABC transporter substrate-binding protein [Noviherbaspirillum autotrophicum]|uniref:ABC transporter substrate-binding protein n=1 Tax=Noviherbaspirillum autotrophicum TaxID=709839 RepID=A0A0C2BWW1_9BURK|nr:ABC transporter substrate-binding protein [Noviherbaspirillum autotrophicum]KIF82501.1 ABC transporter substrate-binding protein [Noviherbaspirillum autotrophicum]